MAAPATSLRYAEGAATEALSLPYPSPVWRQIRNDMLSDSNVLAQRARATQHASRILLDSVHEPRRQNFGIYRRLAHRNPRLRYFAPMSGASGAPLSVETEDRPEGHLIRAAGEIDLSNVALLRVALEPAVQNSQSVIVDLSGVTYLDSTALHAIVTFDRQLKAHDGRLVVIGPPFLFKLLQITGLRRHLEVVPSLAAASAMLGGDGSS